MELELDSAEGGAHTLREVPWGYGNHKQLGKPHTVREASAASEAQEAKKGWGSHIQSGKLVKLGKLGKRQRVGNPHTVREASGVREAREATNGGGSREQVWGLVDRLLWCAC